MKYENFRFSDAGFIILHKRYTFKRPEGRKTWPSKPAETSEEEFFTARQYENFVTSIPFFNRFGGRASCRASWSYTVAGYLPAEISTISPDATIKHVDKFHFVSFPLFAARDKAGFRENDVLDHCDRVKLYKDGEHVICTFYHWDGEHSAEFDATTRRWVG